jgi:hypothetical protein
MYWLRHVLNYFSRVEPCSQGASLPYIKVAYLLINGLTSLEDKGTVPVLRPCLSAIRSLLRPLNQSSITKALVVWVTRGCIAN